jgi:hypothetical protein
LTTTNDFWEVWTPEGYIMTAGTAEQVRIEVEEKLQDALGFLVMIESNDDDTDDEGKPVFRFYLHSDNEEDRTEDELKKMADLGLRFYDTEENQSEAICRILGITVTR